MRCVLRRRPLASLGPPNTSRSAAPPLSPFPLPPCPRLCHRRQGRGADRPHPRARQAGRRADAAHGQCQGGCWAAAQLGAGPGGRVRPACGGRAGCVRPDRGVPIDCPPQGRRGPVISAIRSNRSRANWRSGSRPPRRQAPHPHLSSSMASGYRGRPSRHRRESDVVFPGMCAAIAAASPSHAIDALHHRPQAAPCRCGPSMWGWEENE